MKYISPRGILDTKTKFFALFSTHLKNSVLQYNRNVHFSFIFSQSIKLKRPETDTRTMKCIWILFNSLYRQKNFVKGLLYNLCSFEVCRVLTIDVYFAKWN